MYLVSFGDSRKYKVVSSNGHYDRLNEVREEVEKYLKEKFPNASVLKYYREPHVEDVPEADMAKYADYPALDDAAVKEIEAVLSEEVTIRRDQAELNDNAPFNTVAPEY